MPDEPWVAAQRHALEVAIELDKLQLTATQMGVVAPSLEVINEQARYDLRPDAHVRLIRLTRQRIARGR